MSSTPNPLVFEGLQLMLVGMGTVFVFLTLLVFAVKLMSSLILRYLPVEAPAVDGQATPSQLGGGVPPAHIAAVAAAIEKHRST